MLFLKSNFSKSMLMLTAGFISACGGSSSTPPPVMPNNPPGETGNPDQKIPDGVWIQKGFGRALNVTRDSVKIYDYTRQSCFNNSEITHSDLDGILTIESVETEEVIATEDNGVLVFSKRESLPPACLDNRLIAENGPVSTLNHLIHNFNDYYPFFEARGLLDWDERVRKARLNVSDQTTEEDLIGEIIDLLSGLEDGHVTVTGNSDFTLGDFEFSPSNSVRSLTNVLISAFESQSEITDLNAYIDIQFERLEAIRNSYFDEGSLKMAGGESQDVFQWATIGNGRVGYIEVGSMNGISDNDSETHLMATEKVMDRALTDLANTEALIVNVMVNNGGDLAISDAIANRFSTEKLTVSAYEVISYDDSAMPQRLPLVERELSPTERVSYTRPVATISGPNTVSAAEHFLLSMRALKHPVCFIGEPSNGVLSVILGKQLPTQGLRLGMTNQIVYDHTGQNFEVSGVPVDIEAVTFAVPNADTERSQAMDAALIALGFGDLANSPSQTNDCAFTDARTRFELSAP